MPPLVAHSITSTPSSQFLPTDLFGADGN
jgi:hypothetical protein